MLTVPVGRWIDRGNRLSVVRASIIGQRGAVAASCGLFSVMLERDRLGLTDRALWGLFAGTVMFSCAEKLCAGVNVVAVERDWVVVITEGDEEGRRSMGARMRRIDLFCKLVGPLAIAAVAAASVPVAVYSTLAMSMTSVAVEYFCIKTVFLRVPALRRPVDEHAERRPPNWLSLSRLRQTNLRDAISHIFMIPALRLYFTHPACIPSFSLSMLYLTVLAFSGQMLTYLLASGSTLWQVGIIRAVATAIELSATWLAPRLMKRIGIIRTGLWSVTWQMAWLAAGATWLFYYYGHGSPATRPASALGLIVAVALSRVGLWGFDLSVQGIVQDEVEDDRRGIFSTVEASFQNVFDLLSWTLTIIWSSPESFQWPAVISMVAVYAAGGLYTSFLRRRRGHLLHAPSCLDCKSVEEDAIAMRHRDRSLTGENGRKRHGTMHVPATAAA